MLVNPDWNSIKFCFWNPESGKILLVVSGIIRNPTNDWNRESTFHWHGLESSSWIPLHGGKVECNFVLEMTSIISDQNCTTWSSITTLLQPFWNRRIQSLAIFYWSSWPDCWKAIENKKAFTSHFVLETEMMRYRAKMVRFKKEMKRFRTWMMPFTAKNSLICELITLLRANQIAGIASDFKMDIINI